MQRFVTSAAVRITPLPLEKLWRGRIMSLGTILLIILILLLLGVIPNWSYSGSWGYGPSGIVGVVLVIVLILLLLGRI